MLVKWTDYYHIVQVDNPNPDVKSWILGLNYYQYELRDKENNLIGTYGDYKYASKQAKYKFKKLLARLEKILLG